MYTLSVGFRGRHLSMDTTGKDTHFVVNASVSVDRDHVIASNP